MAEEKAAEHVHNPQLCIAAGMDGLIMLTLGEYTAALQGCSRAPAPPAADESEIRRLNAVIHRQEEAIDLIESIVEDPALDFDTTMRRIRNAVNQARGK